MTSISVLPNRDVVHTPDQPLLTVEGVSVVYGDTPVLENISFELDLGERIAVVGPNGAGKSTLFKLIVGEIRPARGAIHVQGSAPGDHICIAYVPQRSQIDWSFPVTVRDVVMMGRVGQIGLFRWPRRRDWEFVNEALVRVNATHLAEKQIGELSGGQQQRVFIARALAQQAQLLLLDEPLNGLDIPSRDALFRVLDDIHASGEVTTVVATHDLNQAAEQFAKVMLLNRRIIAFGQPAAVLTSENLLEAYGGHAHAISGETPDLVIADTCCDHDDREHSAVIRRGPERLFRP